MPSGDAGPRIERTLFEGRDAWIKRPEKPRSNGFSFLHSCLGFFLPDALQPTGSQGGMQGLLDEADRLKTFAAASVRVPSVLEVTDDYIVLSDCGTQLRQILHEASDAKDVQKWLRQAVVNLADLHAKGLVHGRPHLKDMTVFGDDIYLLDLEEDPVNVMPLQDAQARDIWLLLSSCAEFCTNVFEDLSELLSLYQNTATHDCLPAMKALGQSLRPFGRIIGGLRASTISRDVFGAYWAIKVFEDL